MMSSGSEKNRELRSETTVSEPQQNRTYSLYGRRILVKSEASFVLENPWSDESRSARLSPHLTQSKKIYVCPPDTSQSAEESSAPELQPMNAGVLARGLVQTGVDGIFDCVAGLANFVRGIPSPVIVLGLLLYILHLQQRMREMEEAHKACEPTKFTF